MKVILKQHSGQLSTARALNVRILGCRGLYYKNILTIMCPLYDRLLALLTNIKLGWKHSSLLRKFVTYIRKKFYNISPRFDGWTLYHIWYFKDPLIFNDKRLLVPKYSGATSLEVLCPLYFWFRFSDRISLFCTVYKLLF
jgi:hypothetical protein